MPSFYLLFVWSSEGKGRFWTYPSFCTSLQPPLKTMHKGWRLTPIEFNNGEAGFMVYKYFHLFALRWHTQNVVLKALKMFFKSEIWVYRWQVLNLLYLCNLCISKIGCLQLLASTELDLMCQGHSQQAKAYQKYIKKMTNVRSWIGPYMKFELLSHFSYKMTCINSRAFYGIGKAYQWHLKDINI